MLKVYFVLIALLVGNISFAMGCNPKTAVCGIGKQAVAMMASSVGTMLQCTELAEVQSDFDKQFQKWGMCPDVQLKTLSNEKAGLAAKSIPNTICVELGGFMLAAAAGGAIPAKWKCDPSATVELLKIAVKEGCDKIVP